MIQLSGKDSLKNRLRVNNKLLCSDNYKQLLEDGFESEYALDWRDQDNDLADSSFDLYLDLDDEFDWLEDELDGFAGPLLTKLKDTLRRGKEYLAVRLAISAGNRDENKLTNILFFARYPERQGQPIREGEPNYKHLVQEWLDIRKHIVRPALASGSGTPQPSQTKLKSGKACTLSSGGRCIRCGDCETCERRITAAVPRNLLLIPPELQFQGRKGRLNQEALQAYQRLLRAARADGIPAPYLAIFSSYRGYDTQAGLWRKRLLTKFSNLGYSSTKLKCVATAIDRTTKALKSQPIPHPKSSWLNRFLKELQKTGCPGLGNAGSMVRDLRKTTAPPGRSSHQTGRTVDIAVGHAPGFKTASSKLTNVKWQRSHTPYKWMVCNAHRFGFSPYIREPWHWEYNP
ncbi:D-alanyl-D-alanine carboxypeptidase family protein [Acaryochloris sp. IP29b_bin.148]|uniref:D-alanyl-D-alanine carboxypeptidase family protein n=1 Tax=Acaryochloris sp. IP29b_bin.148 TaxID=2969218 RepID=UPI0026371BA7|nr:D-alanyl-D-alanine carboxypeptidase family protein [Acaryochloris sp. IP29b_bin.148]